MSHLLYHCDSSNVRNYTKLVSFHILLTSKRLIRLLVWFIFWCNLSTIFYQFAGLQLIIFTKQILQQIHNETVLNSQISWYVYLMSWSVVIYRWGISNKWALVRTHFTSLFYDGKFVWQCKLFTVKISSPEPQDKM